MRLPHRRRNWCGLNTPDTKHLSTNPRSSTRRWWKLCGRSLHRSTPRAHQRGCLSALEIERLKPEPQANRWQAWNSLVSLLHDARTVRGRIVFELRVERAGVLAVQHIDDLHVQL